MFVETFRPGVADRLGVGYPAVNARNPRIVYCSISAFGQDSPYRAAPHDLALEAMSGCWASRSAATASRWFPACRSPTT